MTTPETTTTKLSMLCTCGGRKNSCDALMAEVMERLALESEAFTEHPVDTSNLLSEVCYSFAFNFETPIYLDGIWTDQWSQVFTKDMHGNRASVECDQVEHGLAALWKYYADLHGVSLLPDSTEPGSAERADFSSTS